MSLGDQLSPEQKKQFVLKALNPGSILHLFCEFITPPKHKFLVLGSVEPAPILFAINSKVSPYIVARQHLAQCQVMLYQSDHSFLKYDSFLDCTTAIRDFSLDDLLAQVVANFSNIKSRLTEADRAAVMKAVSRSMTLEERVKKVVLQSLARPPF